MTRKSKQPGGHNPLTYAERKSKLAEYGTKTARLGSECHTKFGDCCLGLTAAVDPVATPSGHIYSREAIVSYLLTKNQELKQARIRYEAQLTIDKKRDLEKDKQEERNKIQKFTLMEQCPAQMSKETHAAKHESFLKRKIDTESKANKEESLKRTSYWLSESQPEYSVQATEEEVRKNPPPTCPPSPMSGKPLKLKDLMSIDLQRDGGDDGKCMCSVSSKAITTQEVVLIKKTKVVILKDVLDTLTKSSSSASSSIRKICPVTGKKFKDKDVITLKKGTSGFAASGDVVAKKYRPTLT